MSSVVSVNIPVNITPPKVSQDLAKTQAEIDRYCARINDILTRIIQNNYQDHIKGGMVFEKYSAKPTTADLDEGQVGFYLSGGNRCMAMRFSGAVTGEIFT